MSGSESTLKITSVFLHIVIKIKEQANNDLVLKRNCKYNTYVRK